MAGKGSSMFTSVKYDTTTLAKCKLALQPFFSVSQIDIEATFKPKKYVYRIHDFRHTERNIEAASLITLPFGVHNYKHPGFVKSQDLPVIPHNL